MDNNFKPREVWLASDADIPETMKEHVRDGGSVYMMEQPKNGTAFISMKEDGMGLSTHVGMHQVSQEVTISEAGFASMPGSMQDHVKNGGKLYLVGEPENGSALVSASKPMQGMSACSASISTLVDPDTLDGYAVSDDGRDFADAVAGISGPEEQMNR